MQVDGKVSIVREALTRVWTLTMRPETLDQICGHQERVRIWKHMVDAGRLPSMLLYGPPGSGKTCSAKCLVRAMNDRTCYNDGATQTCALIEMNASEKRRQSDIVQQVRDSVTRYAAKGKVSYLVVFIDEAEGMTREAQLELARVIQDCEQAFYSCPLKVSFILACNDFYRVLPGLAQECECISYDKPSTADIAVWITGQLLTHGWHVNDADALVTMIKHSHGDLRSLIHSLQSHCSVVYLRHIRSGGDAAIPLMDVFGGDAFVSAHDLADDLKRYLDSGNDSAMSRLDELMQHVEGYSTRSIEVLKPAGFVKEIVRILQVDQGMFINEAQQTVTAMAILDWYARFAKNVELSSLHAMELLLSIKEQGPA